MSGYSDDFSKSNNAINAENEGRYPASVLAKKIGVKTGAIKALVPTTEWHHSSKFYNSVDYYEEEKAIEMIDELRAWTPAKKSVKVHVGCSGSYLIWGGTRSHPRASEVTFENALVTELGDWFTLQIEGKPPLRKNRNTRGFVLLHDGERLTFN
jgi:hypothetical protein